MTTTYNELTEAQEDSWYEANHELINWNEKPSQAYERLMSSEVNPVDEEIKKMADHAKLFRHAFLADVKESEKIRRKVRNKGLKMLKTNRYL